MTTTHITGAPLEDRIAIGALSLEGYAPLAEHLKARLGISDSVADCATLTAGLRSLMLETPAQDQAQVTSGSTPQRDSGVPPSIR